MSRQAGQRTGQQAGRRATTKDTSGARECGWWMDGDLVSVWGWEIGSLETTRWRRDRCSKCYATSLRLVRWRGYALLEDARVCSNGHVTASIVQQCESASLVIVVDGCQQARRERHCRRAHSHASQSKDVWSTSTTSTLPRSPQASRPRGECRARPAPPAATLAPTARRRGTAATCTHVDVPCRAGLAVCAAGFTCRDAARPALARWWCGINRLDVQLSRAARPASNA